MILLDTDVMVDILRGYEPAKAWLESVKEIGVHVLREELCGAPCG